MKPITPSVSREKIFIAVVLVVLGFVVGIELYGKNQSQNFSIFEWLKPKPRVAAD